MQTKKDILRNYPKFATCGHVWALANILDNFKKLRGTLGGFVLS
jgi:hypothetical protein